MFRIFLKEYLPKLFIIFLNNLPAFLHLEGFTSSLFQELFDH